MEAQDPRFEARVRESFRGQRVMQLLGAELTQVAPGTCAIEVPYRGDLTQQDGFLHAGVVSTVADSAGGYAGYTLMPAGSRVLTTEFKMHFLAPAQGERFVATATVVKAGRTLTVCEMRVTAVRGGERTVVAFGTQTLICIPAEA
ncbi:MAG TPA: PaaI family thioesterase [Candidatus Thermoplasmatota archaeon]|nr:PaaI family thioesterase [Candidatus Thermoplasmatota archaeon]